MSMKGESDAMTVPAAVEMIRATSPEDRSRFASRSKGDTGSGGRISRCPSQKPPFVFGAALPFFLGTAGEVIKAVISLLIGGSRNNGSSIYLHQLDHFSR
jgi:hypothetical protein